MRIFNNLTIPAQASYTFSGGQLHNDPSALTNYLAAQASPNAKADWHTRSYEKAQRLQRMAARANKARNRRLEDQ